MPDVTTKLLPRVSLALLFGLSLILWFRPLLNAFALAMRDDRYSHIFLILPISAAMIVQEWRWRSLDSPPKARSAGVLLVFALMLAGLAKWGKFATDSDVPLSISIAGLVIWWIGSFVFCFGGQGFRSFPFPLLFLFWMVPIPAAVLNQIVSLLQQGSAVAAQALFWLARVPVSREGIVLSIPGADIEVATECSSIRSSLMLVVTTMVLAQLLLRSPKRKLAIILASLPLSIAKNGLRIFAVAILGTRVDPSYFQGWLHHHGGIVFFLITLAITFGLIWILRRGEEPAAHLANPVSPAQGQWS
jgi:exosortase